MHRGKSDTEEQYSELHHLAEIQARIGPPPAEFHVHYPLGAGLFGKGNVAVYHSQFQWHGCGVNTNESGGVKGKSLGELKLQDASTLETSEQRLDGEEKRLFLDFMMKMLQWLPEKRTTAQQLLNDPWLNSPSDDD